MPSDKFRGFNVVFTGFRDDNAALYITNNGGRYSNEVRWGVTHVVCKDPTRVTGKVKKAKDMGIQVISLEDFNTIFGWSLAKPIATGNRKYKNKK